VRQERPCPRSLAILEASTTFRGRPSRFPLALALRSPALTRSAIRLRSSSATAPRTVNTIFPVGDRAGGRRGGSPSRAVALGASASTAPVSRCARASCWDGAANKQMVRPAPRRPSWAACSPKWAWTKRVIRNATPTPPPMSGPLNPARSLACACTPRLCAGGLEQAHTAVVLTDGARYNHTISHCLPGELEGVANRPECLDERLKYTVSGETRQI